MIAPGLCEVGMSQRIYYDIDGRLGGPVTFMQLQLMASSGMLQPHHRVRKEETEQWFPARQVKGLFSAAEVAAAAAPPAPAENESPFASWGPPPAPAAAEVASDNP